MEKRNKQFAQRETFCIFNCDRRASLVVNALHQQTEAQNIVIIFLLQLSQSFAAVCRSQSTILCGEQCWPFVTRGKAIRSAFDGSRQQLTFARFAKAVGKALSGRQTRREKSRSPNINKRNKFGIKSHLRILNCAINSVGCLGVSESQRSRHRFGRRPRLPFPTESSANAESIRLIQLTQ